VLRLTDLAEFEGAQPSVIASRNAVYRFMPDSDSRVGLPNESRLSCGALKKE